ncbi:MAG TPA: hypothetical protein VKW78_06225 [Terriglobales bacterium]|nr:hypothetical protein [Terriglobales bacterium]
MKTLSRVAAAALAVFCLPAVALQAQKLEPVPRFPLSEGPLHIHQIASPNQPFTVAGDRGAAFGSQSGEFELWQFPMKLLHGLRIQADLQNYDVPLDVNALSSSIDVYPDHTTITFAHAAIVVKEHIFAPRNTPAGTQGVVVMFEINSTRPGTIHFFFEPDLVREWPASNFGHPSAEWVKVQWGDCYVLHTENAEHYAMIAMPRADHGILPPYQERPHSYPLEFRIAFDPKRDAGSYFPVLFALPDGKSPGTPQEYTNLGQHILQTNSALPLLYEQTRDYWAHFFDHRLTSETPDRQFDDELRWAEVAIDQMQARWNNEVGLAAGWYESGASSRPGFGWFFGRDTLWSTYALHSEGDFALSRTALMFLIRRQRDDGKIMHEWANAEDIAHWRTTPYFYAAADSTPLYIMAMDDYVRSSADLNFIRTNWESLKKAYQFERSHTDRGVYDNSQGTGWVEEWASGPPHQELYLGALDEQSCEAMSRLAALMNDSALSSSAASTAQEIRGQLATYRQSDGFYAFSRNADGSFDTSPTIFPSVAWWSGTYGLPDAGTMFSRWGSQEFSTDWGTRSLSPTSSHYDPLLYHQGSVWPLYTGWVSMAEYRTGRTLSAYAHMRENADLTFANDLGAVTELLSGEFFVPFGRSSSHQLWSSAMVFTPAVRGLFGLEVDALHHRIRLNPSLPAEWDRAELDHVQFGDNSLTITLTRRSGVLQAEVSSHLPVVLCLDPEPVVTTSNCARPVTTRVTTELKLPAVEVGWPTSLPFPGAITSHPKVLEQVTSNGMTLLLAAPGGTVLDLPIRFNRQVKLAIEGAQQEGGVLRISFPHGNGYVQRRVELRW